MGTETYLEVLSRGDCLRLLPTVPVGWLAYCHPSRPQLVLVNFVVHGDEVVARTSYGSKLAAAAHGLVMSFGVGDTDPSTRTGWTVTVTGRARLMGNLEVRPSPELAPLESWAPGYRDFHIGIPIDDVSGRRIRTPQGSHRGDTSCARPP